MIDVRPFDPTDLDSILLLTDEMQRFYGEAIDNERAARLDELRAALNGPAPHSHVLLAWQDNSCVGFVSYSMLWPAVGLTSSLYLKELFVSSDARRSGVATTLMGSLLRLAREAGLTRIEWTTEPTNEEAMAFYASLGAESLPNKTFFRISL